MTKPQRLEYEQAKENIEFLTRSINASYKKIMNLVEELSNEKQCLNDYQRLIEQNKQTVLIYESFEEVENNKAGDKQ